MIEVEVLEAKKLLLGGKLAQPKNQFDFEAALNRVFAYLENPLQRWKKNEPGERQMVLRIIF